MDRLTAVEVQPYVVSLDAIAELNRQFSQLHALLENTVFPTEREDSKFNALTWLIRDQADRVQETLDQLSHHGLLD